MYVFNIIEISTFNYKFMKAKYSDILLKFESFL